jgi:hypothetical protein
VPLCGDRGGRERGGGSCRGWSTSPPRASRSPTQRAGAAVASWWLRTRRSNVHSCRHLRGRGVTRAAGCTTPGAVHHRANHRRRESAGTADCATAAPRLGVRDYRSLSLYHLSSSSRSPRRRTRRCNRRNRCRFPNSRSQGARCRPRASASVRCHLLLPTGSKAHRYITVAWTADPPPSAADRQPHHRRRPQQRPYRVPAIGAQSRPGPCCSTAGARSSPIATVAREGSARSACPARRE